MPRMEHTGGTQWKSLLSSLGHAHDDDDDEYGFNTQFTLEQITYAQLCYANNQIFQNNIKPKPKKLVESRQTYWNNCRVKFFLDHSKCKPQEVPASSGLLPVVTHRAGHQMPQSEPPAHHHWCHQTCSSHQTGSLQHTVSDYEYLRLINSNNAIYQESMTMNKSWYRNYSASIYVLQSWTSVMLTEGQWRTVAPTNVVIFRFGNFAKPALTKLDTF